MKTNIAKVVAAILISLTCAAAGHAQLILPNTPAQPAAPKGPDINLFADALKKLEIPFTKIESGNKSNLKAQFKLKNGGQLTTNIMVDKGSFWMTSELAQVPQGKQLSVTQATDLLEVNSSTYPCFFTYQRQSGSVSMMLEITTWQVTEKSVLADLELLAQNVLNTQKYWTLKFDALDAPAPAVKTETNFAPMPTNNAAKPKPVQPTAIDLANTAWAGEESLAGYSKLGFEFQGGNTVIMHDTDGATKGTYRIVGNQVTLTFGTVTYQGIANGNTIVGNANNGKTNWKYQVNLTK